MLNTWTGIGRLTKAPECRYTQAGKAVTSFDIAVDREYKDANGNKETDFFSIITWGKLAEVVANHLDKGRLVAVTGRLQARTYETQDGQKRKVYEIVADKVVFLDRAKEQKPDAQGTPGGDVFPEVDTDIPF